MSHEAIRNIVLIFIISKASWGLDAACPEGQPGHFDMQGLEINYFETTEKQTAANVYLEEYYKGKPLHTVTLEYGSWGFTEKGEEETAPAIIANLEIRKHGNKPFAQIFLGSVDKKASLTIHYGELCGFFTKIELLAPK